MLDPRYVAEHVDEVRAALGRRSPAAAASLGDDFAETVRARRAAVQEVEGLLQQRNAESEAMAKLDKKSTDFAEKREALKALGTRIKEGEHKLGELEKKLAELVAAVPNLPDPSVPDGADETANVVVRAWGTKPEFSFTPKAHWDIGTGLGILDFDRAAKLSGSRFTVLFGAGARLERALINFMLDLHTREQGYVEVLPPFMVKDSALFGTGQLPKFEEDLFKIERRSAERNYDLYLIPTAEVPVTNLHADEILEAASLPIAYAAYTPCFRAEAGSHGRDVRGLVRQHQFDKVEIVRFTTPETSSAQHELLTSHAEEVLKRLGLHFRTSLLCAGDMGAISQKTYDLEVWLPSQGVYREISSCSNFGEYQARRAQIRYRPEPKGKPRLLHTLNGSGLAVGRTLIAVLEQYQQADGSVVVPEALRPFMGCEVIRGR
ncbi:serine--tRNA ligase [Chondromyces apiculatus]|uniref:Serine--tRNA ligase n=1 Tax=Chondromyces apiculatus DSM 436 TaxID=1192034 RepID=A0A017T2Z8_9BACT|nr:serine--tRNA ligase [Chondromyces apiculatus]EYF03609.1 Seryl-tRNA synthetase [Chondromyces apiculatus DSM 436]